jgi:hypothetical protein
VDKRARPGNEGTLVVPGEILLRAEPGSVEDARAFADLADLAAVGAANGPGEAIAANEPAEQMSPEPA